MVAGRFAEILNLTDEEVERLLERTRQTLDSQGEYDQGDLAALEWDDAYDVIVIAQTLWKDYERQTHG